MNRSHVGVRLRIQQTAGIPMNLPSVYEEVPLGLVLPAGRYHLVFEFLPLPLPPGVRQRNRHTETVELVDSQVLTINIQ